MKRFCLGVLLVLVTLLVGCASAPQDPRAQHFGCLSDAELVMIGQQALNNGLSPAEFEKRLGEVVFEDPKHQKMWPRYRELIRKGYRSIMGADERIIAQKAYDDCMEGV